MVPRRFFWFLDLTVLAVAFGVACVLVPNLQPILAPGGPFHADWAERLFSPSIWDGKLPPVRDLLWILVTMTLAALPVLTFAGLCRLLLECSRTRIVVGSVFVKRKGDQSAIPNEEMLVTRAQKSVTVGHRIQGANDDQTDKNGPDH